MKFQNLIILGVASLALANCASMKVAPPTEETIKAETFRITVPKGLTNEEKSLLKGVKLKPFTNYSGQSPVLDFFSVEFKENTQASELATQVCRGVYHSDTRNKYQSCVGYLSKVNIENKDDSYSISIAPYKKASKQGVNAMFFPISLPKTSISDLYRWLSYESISYNLKLTSEFPSEALKGNFDRNFTKYSWSKGEQNAATKQFKDSYIYTVQNGITAKIGAAFYPYKNGSLVKVYIVLNSIQGANSKSINWTEIKNNISSKIAKVVND